jgi:signal transduction histidine kinase
MGEMLEEQKEALCEVLHNAADLLEMINSLLDLTKIESGTMMLDIRTFDLREAFRRVAGTLAPLVQKKGQSFTVEFADDLPSLCGDERKIQQTLLNLLANANKFTPAGGMIQVKARHFSSWKHLEDEALWWRRIEGARVHFENGAVEITVSDNGVGIPPDHLERVFDMFHQADSSSTRNFGGTGLGLALARKFIELHHGRIWVESDLGKGAIFTVILPVVKDPELERLGFENESPDPPGV